MNAMRLLGITPFMLLAASLSLSATAEHAPLMPASVPQAAPRVLLLDCTKTSPSTMRIWELAALLRSSGALEVNVQFGDAPGVFGVPEIREDDLQDGPFDVIAIIPRRIEDGSADRIWIITNILPGSPQQIWREIALMRIVFAEAFTGLAQEVDPTLDLRAPFTSSLYAAQGWLR